MKRLHLHIWGIPSPQTKLKLGGYSRFYEECSICGKLRLIGGAENDT